MRRASGIQTRWRRCARSVVAFAGTTLLSAQLPSAAGEVLAQVGSQKISVAELARRAELVSPVAWQRLGTSWAERRRRFVEDVLVAEALLAEHAARNARRLASPQSRALAQRLSEQLYAEAARTPIGKELLEREYEARRERHYAEPERLSLWRILVSDEALARRLIAELGAPTEAAFRRLAREHSLDEATRMRGGNLGYVAAGGQTHMPELRVSPLLFAAASAVKDGQLVAAPVAESGRFAVLWRRDSRPARARPLSEVTAELEALIVERRYFEQLGSLLEQLRKAELSEHRAERVRELELPAAEPAASPASALPKTSRTGPAVDPVPRATDRGLR